MSESSKSGWPFEELGEAGFDIDTIFNGGKSDGEQSSEQNPFEAAAAQVEEKHEATEKPAAPVVEEPPKAEKAPQRSKETAAKKAPAEADHNPIAAAFEQVETERAQQGLFEKPPVFVYRTAKEPIHDLDMTFEELRIRKSEDFADLEEGKFVSWSVEYCGIRKDIKDPKGTKIGAVKNMIEKSKEFMDALKKSKDKNPDCLVKPKIVGKTKGNAAPYKGYFRTLEEARASDKVICLIPAQDGQIYEMDKLEQGEFIAPKSKVLEFQPVRAGFSPALPLIPMSLMCQIISFFRSFMREENEYEALALIYWDKQEKRYFAYIPTQVVSKENVKAVLLDCPYDDDSRYIRYADIHSHNSMEAFFSAKDDKDERGTGLYLVVGELDRFYPDLKARICCGGSFVSIDPAEVIEGFDKAFPAEWKKQVDCGQPKIAYKQPREDVSFGGFLRSLLPPKQEVLL